MADLTLSTEEGKVDLSRPTNSDLSSLQYHYVKHDASEEVVACGANEKCLGILQNAPDGSSIEATAKVRIQGVSKLKMSETVIAGNFMTSTAASEGEIADAANEEYYSQVLGSAEDGDLATVIMTRGEVTATDA